MDAFMDKIISICTEAGGKIILALLIFIIGKAIIKKLLKLLTKGKGYQKMDATVQSFFMNFAKIALYIVLVVSIISVLGVPMASVITVLASCGVAVGLALQGALANIVRSTSAITSRRRAKRAPSRTFRCSTRSSIRLTTKRSPSRTAR